MENELQSNQEGGGMQKQSMNSKTIYSYLNEVVPQKFDTSVLYHYTAFRTFPVFFEENADLYCTHFAALNDSAEVRQGWEMAIRFLNVNKGFPKGKCNLLWNCYTKGVLKNKVVSPWIMSFSRAQDSLAQWVAYTDKKEGGYALGFEREKLQAAVNSIAFDADKKMNGGIRCRVYILPCIYSDSDREVIEGLFDFYFGQANELFERVKSATEPDWKDVASIVAKVLLVSSIIKHESFKYEEENRLIIQPTISTYDECKFIGGKPRWETKIASHCKLGRLLKEIWVSPHGDRQVLLSSAQIMVAKHGLSCEIKESSSPYNGR